MQRRTGAEGSVTPPSSSIAEAISYACPWSRWWLDLANLLHFAARIRIDNCLIRSHVWVSKQLASDKRLQTQCHRGTNPFMRGHLTAVVERQSCKESKRFKTLVVGSQNKQVAHSSLHTSPGHLARPAEEIRTNAPLGVGAWPAAHALRQPQLCASAQSHCPWVRRPMSWSANMMFRQI